MNITIAGYGFVGKAHAAVLGSKDYHSVIVYDPYLSNDYSYFGDPDLLIVCVSTPPNSDGSCDYSNVLEVIARVDHDVPILIKSTISVEAWRAINNLYPKHQIAFSPEFLRAKTAIEDFKNSDRMFIGGKKVHIWHTVFMQAFDNPQWVTQAAEPEELILAKYARNSFLALKVSFFNQLYDLCQSTNIDYNAVANITADDKRIGNSHTVITPERGYGGHCFPKDVAAFLKTAEKYDTSLSILQEAQQYNNLVRR